MANSTPLLQAKSVHKIYGSGSSAYEALRGVDLAIQKGEAIAILGKSGSGKSTLMHLLAGLDRPTQGAILFAGRSLSDLTERDMALLRNRKVGFIFQQFFLAPTLTVTENVMLPLKIAGIAKSERLKKAHDAIEKVDLLDWASHRATDLSGGQKQRVAIARALVNSPEVVFADEPTGNLDTETGRAVIRLLFHLQKQEGITLIVVTHDEDLARLCHRQVHIQDGRFT